MSGNFYSDNTGYNAKQLNIQSGTMGKSVAFESFKFGTHIVSSAEETAVSIKTGITVGGFIVQVYKSGELFGSYDVNVSDETIIVTINGDDKLTNGDVIYWFAFVNN